MMYGSLCTEFYDADKKFCSSDELDVYKTMLDKTDIILEPMCGSGRLLIPLLQEGYNVHGFDNSNDMLNSCKERASKLGLHPELWHGSIEEILLQQRYNKIIIPFGSFQLLHPRESACQALVKFKNSLLPKGKLILHSFIPWEWLFKDAQHQFSERVVTTDDGAIITIKSQGEINKLEQFSSVSSFYTKTLNGNIVAEENEKMYISWYYRYEMELMLEKSGFKNICYFERKFNNENHMFYTAC